MNTINNVQLHNTPSELQQLFEDYLSECEYSKRLRPQTLKGYREVFSVFQKVLPEITAVNDLCPSVISTFFKRLSTRKRIVGRDTIKFGVKPSTVKTYFNKLMVFFKWLENHGHIENGALTSHVAKPPLPRYEDDRALSDEEVSKIIASISMHSISDPFLYKRDITIVSLLLYTGIRKGELLSLRVQDIDFNNRTLFINGKTSKSKKSRNIPLHFTLITHLKIYLKERQQRKSKCDALIISCKSDKPLTEFGLKHWVNKYIRLSNVEFHIHRFRHTFACTLAKENADITSIMKVMGHSSVQMTQHYLRSITPEHSRPFIEKLSF